MSSIPYSYGEVLLDIRDVYLQYGDKIILNHISAQIRDILRPGLTQGQVSAIIGRSGSGKTQLARIVSGLNQPTSGGVFIDSQETPVRPGDVGVVSQTYPLFEHRTVYGNLMRAARKTYKNKKEADMRVREMLQEFGIMEQISSYPSQLSGGQRQRVAIIQQLLCSKTLLIMDEPFANLDLIAEEQVCDLITHTVSIDDKMTILIISHDLTAALSIADHAWILGKAKDLQGNLIGGSTIVESCDLIKEELCWRPGIQTDQRFVSYVADIKSKFRTL